jgi:HEXXH motif-containing protein
MTSNYKTPNTGVVAIEDEAEIIADEESAFFGFSTPLEPFDEPLAELMAAEYARQVFTLFSDRCGAVIREAGSGIDDLLSRLREADVGFELAWSWEVGALHSAAISGDAARARNSAAAFALRAGALRATGEWELRLDEPSSFLWDAWILPACDHLAVSSDGDEAVVNITLDGRRQRISFTLCPDRRGWQCDRSDSVEHLPQLTGELHRITLLPRRMALECRLIESDREALESFPASVLQPVEQALGLLQEHAAPYYLWVSRIIHRLTILHSTQDMMQSGSLEKHYGTIYVSDHLRPVAVAEMLIHEASHQYYELLCKLERAVDPAHKQLYYSPVKECLRPLERVLLAYHAFANVMLFYRAAIDCGLDDDGFLAGLRPTLTENLEQLEQPLRESDALTPIGRALIQPLMKRGMC